METVTPLVDVKRKAIETAFHYVMCRGYNGSETKAVAALKRRCPNNTKSDCLKWFNRSEMLFKDCIEFLEQNETAVFTARSQDIENFDVLTVAGPIKIKYSDLPEEQIKWVLDVVFLNYHLR